jgi:hypothetical protein
MRLFLKYAAASSDLSEKVTINAIHEGSHIPVAHTCTNTLECSITTDEEEIKKSITTALEYFKSDPKFDFR